MNLFDLYAKIAFDDGEYTSGVNRAKKTNADLRSDVAKLAAEYKKQGMNSSDAMKKAWHEIDRTQYEGVQNSERHSKSFGESWESAGAKISKFASGVKSSFNTIMSVSSAAIGAASTAIATLGKIAFDYNSEIESYATNFEVMLGDAEKAAQMVADLEKLGASTPFEMSDLASATQTLLAFNVAGDKTKGVLTKLGDISLGNTQKLESLTRAYGKMNASQNVTLEDINMMIDAGYNPLLNVMDETGETMEQLYDRISRGEMSFSEIEKAIDAATGAGGMYENGMQKASQTTQGLISTLKDNAQALVGKVFKPITDGLKNTLLPGAIEAIQALSDAYEEKGIEGMVDAAGEIIGAAVGELANNAPDLIESGVSLIDSLLGGIEKNLPAITKGAGDTFFAFVGGITTLVPKLLDTAGELVSNLGQYIINNPDKVIEAAGDIIESFGVGLIKFVSNLSQTAIDVLGALGTYIVDNAGKIWDSAVSIGEKIVYAIWDGLVGIWDSVINIPGLLDGLNVGINYSLTGNVPSVPVTGLGGHGGRGGSFAAVSVHGSHAEGLGYVPFDGYIAELHKGERVLTAKESEQYGTTSFGDVIININGVAYESMRELAQDVAEEIQNIVDERG